jgi:hypothetical protein
LPRRLSAFEEHPMAVNRSVLYSGTLVVFVYAIAFVLALS